LRGLRERVTAKSTRTDKKVVTKTKKHLRVVDDVEQPPSLIQIIEAKSTQERAPRTGFFRPSALFGCDRENVFHYQMVREEERGISDALHRILGNGTAVHSLVQDEYLSNSFDYWYVKEPRVRRLINGAWVKGSCDGVLIRRSDMFRWGIEIKTLNHAEFMRLTKPKEEHVFQASIYMNLQDLPFITILYWDKDKQLLKEFHVKRRRKVWAEVEERVEYLYSFVDSGKLPKFDKATCNKTFCKYVKHCRKMGAPV
jgi:hypothetical protein